MSTTYVAGSATFTEAGSINLTGIDYTSELGRIATALEVIADNSNRLVTHTNRLADALETSDSSRFADNLQIMVNDIGTIKVLAETTGVKSVSPYDLISAASMYSYYSDNVADLDTLITKIASVPTAKLQTIRDAVENFPRLP